MFGAAKSHSQLQRVRSLVRHYHGILGGPIADIICQGAPRDQRVEAISCFPSCTPTELDVIAVSTYELGPEIRICGAGLCVSLRQQSGSSKLVGQRATYHHIPRG